MLSYGLGFSPELNASLCRERQAEIPGIEVILEGKAVLNPASLGSQAEYWLEQLLPRTRGKKLWNVSDLASADEVVRANEVIQKITSFQVTELGKKPGSRVWVPAGQSQAGWAQKLRLSKVISMEPLGGGTNGAYRVVHEDNKAQRFFTVFKPLAESRPVQDKYYQKNPRDFLRFLFHVREVRASSLYKPILKKYWDKGGKAPIHLPETVEGVLVHKGKSYGVGSFQKWAKGLEVEDIRDLDPTRIEHWRGTEQWREAEAVVRVLDYVFGNSDRFPKKDGEEAIKNIFAEMEWNNEREILRRMNLIDNGLGIPGHIDFTIDQIPIAKHVPRALKEALHELISQEALIRQQQENHFPQWGLDDVFRRWRQVLIRYPL